MFTLGSEFIIGKYKFKGCYSLSIKKSIHEYADEAVIQLPGSAVLRLGKVVTESAQTQQFFRVGDKVSIRLGYNGTLHDEFVGFVKRINKKTPCEIACEGYSYLLRTKKDISKFWKSVSLKEVLQYITEGTEIKLHEQIPELTLKNIKLDHASGTQVIDYIKQLLAGTITAFFIGDTLYMGLAYANLADTTVKHRLGWNTISADDLKERNAADVKVKIELSYRQENGNQIVVSSGEDGGVVRKSNVSAVSDMAQLQQMAEAKLLQECYDGLEGDFSTFLLPFAQPGYRCELSDPRYPERSGNYFLESTETSFGMSGGRRKLQIGIKLS